MEEGGDDDRQESEGQTTVRSKLGKLTANSLSKWLRINVTDDPSARNQGWAV